MAKLRETQLSLRGLHKEKAMFIQCTEEESSVLLAGLNALSGSHDPSVLSALRERLLLQHELVILVAEDTRKNCDELFPVLLAKDVPFTLIDAVGLLGEEYAPDGESVFLSEVRQDSMTVYQVDFALPAQQQCTDLAEVSEWVGLHYKVNFDAEPEQGKLDWIDRYEAAQAQAA